MTLAAQIIDQQVSGIVERHSDAFAGELRLGRDRHRRRAVAFLFLVARTAFDLADEDALVGHLPPGRSGGHAPGSVATKRVTDPVLVAAADGGLSSGSVEHPHAGGIDA